VSQAVNSTLDLETVLATIVAKAVQLSNTDAGVIYAFDELDETLRVRATYGLSDELVAAIRGQPAGASDALRRAIQDRQSLEIADIRDEPPSSVREIAIRAGFRARLVVPLVGTERVVSAQAAGQISQRNHSAPADIRGPIGAGDPECTPVPRDRRKKPPATVGKREQIAVRLQHEPRAAHPPQCHHRTDRNDGQKRGALRHRKGAGATAAREPRWYSPPWPH